jgi:hypothetical protein
MKHNTARMAFNMLLKGVKPGVIRKLLNPNEKALTKAIQKAFLIQKLQNGP